MFKSTGSSEDTAGYYHYSRKQGKFPPPTQVFLKGRRGIQNPANCCLSGCGSDYLSLRTSPQTGVAIPQLEGKCIDNCPTEWGNVAIFGGNRYLIPFIRGIATPVCALARNDSKNTQTPICRFAGRKLKEILNWGQLIFGGSLYMITGNKAITRRLRRNVK